MEKFFIPREVWRPMNAIEIKEGNKYIVRFKNGSVERMIVEDGQLCYKIGGKEGGTVFPSIEDMHSWIREPYECYYHFANMTTNDIPLEFVLPYILKQRMKAKQEANEARKAMKEAIERAEQAEANAKTEIEKLLNDVDRLAEKKAKLLNTRAVEVIEKAEKIVKDNLDTKTMYNRLNTEHKALEKAYNKLFEKYNLVTKRVKRFIALADLKDETLM